MNIEHVRRLTNNIHGWLSDSEGELLYKLATSIPKGHAIVEIGSWKGKSTVWLAKGAQAGQRNEVYAVDLHCGSSDHAREGVEDTCAAFIANLSKAGVRTTVFPLITTSEKAAHHWRGGIGLLWVDGSHRYEDVKRDLLLWKQYLANGARVAIHDSDDQSGPALVVEEWLMGTSEFTVIGRVDTITVASYRVTGNTPEEVPV